ncbi:metal ABC transporter permease [Staphylococcus pseudintermedius]|uniref:Manganese transport system membrane protein MntC n=1 Tax=Staphylococcus pseudintermedius TaxID=283734 RepID=A0A317ZE03_STAPS|nr:metal ABC transporter permease [Staphylococcus pseudintermedius]ADV04857.1 Manganese ABC transporter, inner membrane permease protein SitD [Staphylococcus pseudintermedius HKU10-03]ANQ82629.1 manganese ABC transporter permease [Staphylococcus pseudintermedius]ANQ89136.1 manganese ABC transporter permease [Staphylococcus pseudintermedius]ANS90518.1 Manganese ABC transporter, inner membrane permease protein SitD [Staphylococcus pseudintermedius]ASQ51354.1 manganese ABC transporter permease [S
MSFVQHLFEYQFLSRAMLTAILVGVVCGVVGCLIILRGLSLMGDAMSHAVLPGVALSFLMNIPMFIGAMVTGMLSSIMIGYISEASKTKKDAAIGITFTTFLALGIVLISVIHSATDLYHILFGNILAITQSAFHTTLAVSIVVLALILILYRPLKMSTFDPIFSRMSGLNTTMIHYFVMLLLALVIVASVQTVGVILVVALLITPASTAFLFTKKLSTMMIVSSIFSVISSTLGIYMSFKLNLPSGAVIVLISAVLYGLTFGIIKLINLLQKGAFQTS